jgi:DNA polymerase V
MKAIVDCNNFYCSCERLFVPRLDRQPVVVLSNNDGCVISRSDEAKKVGVAMGVPFFEVRSLLQQYLGSNVRRAPIKFNLIKWPKI